VSEPISDDVNPTPGKRKERKRLPMMWRVIFGLCGALLVLGFFLPWVIAGTALELSGMGLVFAGGDVVQAISGSGRFLLFIIPILGALLVTGAIYGHRLTPWLGALGAGILLVFGTIHVISLFVSSTGVGMWLVVFSALATLLFGALSIGESRRRD
jgi:hypothetical protein